MLLELKHEMEKFNYVPSQFSNEPITKKINKKIKKATLLYLELLKKKLYFLLATTFLNIFLLAVHNTLNGESF